MSGNGKTMQFPAGLPIIGQPVTKSWAAQVVVQCNCAAKEPVMLVLGGIGQCPACQRAYTITGIQFDAQAGQAQISVGVVVTREAAAAAAEAGVKS
jgi:hypothetical protein